MSGWVIVQLLWAVIYTCILVKCSEIVRLENILGTGDNTSLWDAIIVLNGEGAEEVGEGEEDSVDLKGSLLLFFFPIKADSMMEVSVCGQ